LAFSGFTNSSPRVASRVKVLKCTRLGRADPGGFGAI
jgi:hypothetical protein